MAQTTEDQTHAPVVVSLRDLENDTVTFSALEEAFGPASLGILVVKDLPERYTALRAELLSYASYLARLPQSELDILTRPETHYNVGWSHGKEMLKPGQYDLLKGSFYATMLSSVLQSQADDASRLVDPPNVWPDATMMPGFRKTFEELCTLIIEVGTHVARACDRFASEHVPEYETGALERVVKTSRTHRARLLHYFPPSQLATPKPAENGAAAQDEDDWCALHLDDGCLTGLTSALFVDETGELPSLSGQGPDMATMPMLPKSPDPKAGLYIQSRTGAVVKVNIPADCLAFQTGESLEMMTNGKLKAVPHFVRGPSKKSLESTARNTLALFMQPNSGDIVDRRTGMTFGEFIASMDEKYSGKQ